MKNMILLTICSVFLSPAAFANTYAKCGESVDLGAGKVSGYVLEISSENEDFSGPVGLNWNLKLAENNDWLKVNKNITARSFEDVDGNVVVVVTIIMAQASTGPVGTRYKLIGLYDDEPVLEKYTMGGFAGSIKTNTFKCESAND